jgi:type IV secretory pathway VirB10-like protein
MNSKTVLSKILGLLSLEKEVELTYAKLKDGTIVESPTFDVGEPLDVVSEDGTKTPAPDGEHELSLKDESGNENLIKVIVKDGKIEERENVELEMVPNQEIPQQGEKKKENEQADMPGQVKSGTMMAEETDSVEGLPEDTNAPTKEMPTESEDGEKEVEINLGDMAKKMEEMAYRIQEMEMKLEAMMPPVDSEVTDEVAGIKMSEEEELPKLDGAPMEEATKFSAESNRKNYGKKSMDAQSTFLSKLYK